ncbi:MAG: hypothetical protein ACMXYA_01130 [Candidatus Woesearchaeota archaeon]
MKYREIYRDIRSLGSWVLFLLVLGRSMIDVFRPFVDQMVIAAILLILTSYIFSYDGYVARSFIVAVFTSLFYQDLFFTIFISLVTIAIWYSCTKFVSKKSIILGIITGVCIVSIAIFLPYVYLGEVMFSWDF